jgi:hypothetical protein
LIGELNLKKDWGIFSYGDLAFINISYEYAD